MSDSNQILLVETQTGETIASFSIQEREKAYQKATQLEQMGLDIEMRSPGAAKSLAIELGADKKQLEDLDQSLQEEMDDHDDSCCFK